MNIQEVLVRAAQFMDQTKAGGGIYGPADEDLRTQISRHLEELQTNVDQHDLPSHPG